MFFFPLEFVSIDLKLDEDHKLFGRAQKLFGHGAIGHVIHLSSTCW